MDSLFKNKIKSIRELKNYTQQYMAEQLGITQAGYSKIEKGNTVLSYNKLIKIAIILEVSIDDIINFDHKKIIKVNTDQNYNIEKCCNHAVIELYEDKIKLLEKLLNKTEDELYHFKKRFKAY